MIDELARILLWMKRAVMNGYIPHELEAKFNRAVLIADTLKQNMEAGQRNRNEAWLALGMVRGAIEVLGPVGVMASREHTACTPGEGGPFLSEAEELVKGIQKIADRADGVRCVYERIDEAVEALITAMKAGRLEPSDAEELSETLREYARRSYANGREDMPPRLLTDMMKKTSERLVTFDAGSVEFRRDEQRRTK